MKGGRHFLTREYNDRTHMRSHREGHQTLQQSWSLLRSSRQVRPSLGFEFMPIRAPNGCQTIECFNRDVNALAFTDENVCAVGGGDDIVLGRDTDCAVYRRDEA